MKKIIYKEGPDFIEVGGLAAARRDGNDGDRMFRGVAVIVLDDKAKDMLTNPLFSEFVDAQPLEPAAVAPVDPAKEG